MFNIGGPELFVILLVALIVLGPNKLPEAARQVGRAMHELRRISNGFQAELRSALEEPLDTTATRREAVTNTRGTVPEPPADARANGAGAPAAEAEPAEPSASSPAGPDDGEHGDADDEPTA
jgi:Tat protein translocase TatB subunit